METSSFGENCLAFDLNISSDAREKEFEGGDREIYVRGKKSSSFGIKERAVLIEKLNQMRSEKEKLIEMLIISFESYNTLKSQLAELVQKHSGDLDQVQNSKKRKLEVENSINNTMKNDGSYDSNVAEEGSPEMPREIRTNISRVSVRVDPSDTSLVVKDGYHWRKYGQKVTKDNPSPRAYYKCSVAPSCQVKKKVQKSVGDHSILIATYEGEHNHQHPLKAEMLISSEQSASAVFSPISSNCFEYPSPKDRLVGFVGNSIQNSIPASGGNAIQQLMVEQMASTLTRNPSFTAAIAAAISERIMNHDPEMDEKCERMALYFSQTCCS